jgi:hypothetical protein
MEDNEVREYKKAQKFYFNEEGQLVVESNKGVWVDGEQHVKMYGNFVCNAKTMGMVIQQLKGIKVAVGAKETVRHSHDDVVDSILHVYDHTIEHYCILGVDENAVEEYCERLAIDRYTSEEINKAKKEKEEYSTMARNNAYALDTKDAQLTSIKNKIEAYNAMPWIKRIFHKIKF